MTPQELSDLRDRVARAKLSGSHQGLRPEGWGSSKRAPYWREYYWKNRERILARRAERRAA